MGAFKSLPKTGQEPGARGRQARHRYYLLLCLSAAYCLNFVDRQIFSVLAPLIKAEFRLSDTQLGFLSGFAFALLYSVLGIPLARIADRFSARAVIVVSLVAWSGMTYLTALARTVPAMIACRIGVGIGEAGCTPPAHALIARAFPEGERSTAMSIYYFGATIGMALAFVGGGWLGDRFGWRAAFMAVGLPGLLLALIIRFTLPDLKAAPRSDADAEPAPFSQTLSQLLGCASYRAVVLGSCLACLAYLGAMQWVPSYFQRHFHLPMAQIGIGLAISAGASGGLGSLVGGVLADRLSRRDVRWQLWLCAAACLLAVPANFGVYLTSIPVLAFAWLAIPTFLVALTTGPTFSLAQGLAPRSGQALSSAILLFSTNLIGLGLGPLIVGFGSDRLAPALGAQSLRVALLGLLTLGSLSAAAIFLRGAFRLPADLAARDSRQGEHNHCGGPPRADDVSFAHPTSLQSG